MLNTTDCSIILYESNERSFDTQGLGVLSDAASCVVTEELNGIFEVEFEYPVTGIHFDDIELRRIIFVNPTPYAEKQPFRIYSISRPIGGIVTVNAQHISYDLSDCPCKPIKIESLTTATQIWTEISNAWSEFMNEDIPFSFESAEITLLETAKLEISDVTTCRSLLSGGDNTMQSVFDGEFEYGYDTTNNKYLIQFNDKRGTVPREDDDESVTFPEIRYGKNLIDVKQEENCSQVCTHVFPYYKDGDTLITATDILLPVNKDVEYNYKKIMNLDMGSYFSDTPSPSALQEKAEYYMGLNNIGSPKVNLTVSFIYLPDSEEYREVSKLEHVNLGDFVYVKFPKLGVQSGSRVIKTNYNLLTRKYNSIELGDSPTSSLSTIIASVETDVNNVSTSSHKSRIQAALEEAGSMIMGSRGGHVMIAGEDVNGNTTACPPNKPSKIIIADEEDMSIAKNAWVWNKSGLAHYDNYSGGSAPNVAITMEGEIDATFIRTGTLDAEVVNVDNLNADNIKSGTISASRLNVNTAGRNKIHNSAGQNSVSRTGQYVPYWDNSTVSNSAAYNTDSNPNESMALATDSKSYIKKLAGSDYIEQTIDMIANRNYILSGLFCGSKIEIYTYKEISGETYTPYKTIDHTADTSAWMNDSVSLFNYPTSMLIVRLYASSANAGYISDFMIAEGNVPSGWTQAENETYGTYVNIDDNGIEVARNNTNVKTRITNDEFSVYRGDEQRISINADDTYLDKTNIHNTFRVSQLVDSGYQTRMLFTPTDYGMGIYVTSNVQ